MPISDPWTEDGERPAAPKSEARSPWQRFKDSFIEGALHTPIGAEGVVRATGMTGLPSAELNRRERILSDQFAQKRAKDEEAFKDVDTLSPANIGKHAVDLLGNLFGGADPTYAIAPGKNAIQRIAAQATINADQNAISQVIEQKRGVRDEFSPAEVALNAAAGLVLQGGVEAHAKVKTGQMIARGSKYPQYAALNDVIVNHLEGGGTLANPKTSPKGAMGPQQVMPETARDPGFGIKPWNGKTQTDLARVGRQYSAALLDHYKGDTEKTLAAYHGGYGTVDKLVKKYGDDYLSHMGPKTRAYAAKGMGKLEAPIARDGLPGNGHVRPMAPEEISRIMNSPANSSMDADLDAAIREGAEKALEKDGDNVVQFPGEKRPPLTPDELRDFTDPEVKAYNERIQKDRPFASRMTDDEHLTPAERQEMDASAPKPVNRNTGAEDVIGKGSVATTPVNDLRAPEGKLPDQDALTRQLYEHLTNQKAPDNLRPEDMVEAVRTKLAGEDGASRDGKGLMDKAPRNLKQILKDLLDDESGSIGGENDNGAPKGRDGEVPSAAVDKLMAALEAAKPISKKQKRMYSEARSERLGKVAGVQKSTSGESGFFSELSQLKGDLPKVDYESIRENFGQDEIDELFDLVKNHPTMTMFDKINARTGLLKMLGADGGKVPTANEIHLLSQVFPKPLITGLLKNRPFTKRFWDAVGNVVNIPRSLMASFDLSAPFRQGVFLVGRKEFYTSFANMFKVVGSEKAFQALKDEIASRPTYKLMRQGNLALSDISRVLEKREEAFMSDWAEKIPVVGRMVHASNRAYTGFLNKLRADTFDSFVKQAEAIGVDLKHDEHALNSVTRFINAATGRGSLGALNQAAPVLSGVFFSPRLMASRVQMLNPAFYVGLHPLARKEAFKSLLSFSGLALTVLGLASAAGLEVGVDPRSSDFGKIKVGNTRYDILGGFQQYIKFGAQILTGEQVGQDGKVRKLNDPKAYRGSTRLTAIADFLRSKASPTTGYVANALDGKNVVGEPFDVVDETAKLFAPLNIQGMADAYKDMGAKGLLTIIPATFGVGVQTYSPRPKKEKKPRARGGASEPWSESGERPTSKEGPGEPW